MLRPSPLYRAGGATRAAALLLILLAAANLAAQDFSHPSSEPAPQAALIQQANDALAGGDFSAALKILASLNAKIPNNPQVLYNLGLTLEALGPTALAPVPLAPAGQAPAAPLTAESCYRQSIAADPLFPAPYVALGLLLARSARPAEARTDLLAATTLAGIAPTLKARALRALARLELIGNPQQSTPPNSAAAAADLLEALKLAPETPDDILLSAQIAESAADLDAAQQAYRRYLALPNQANDPQAIAGLAHILLAQHRAADAEALLAPALAAHPSDPALTALLAEADLDSNDPAKTAQAVPLLEKLHAARPTDANIARLLARVYLDTNHPEQAEPLYAALIAAQSPHPDPTLLDDRAEALLRLHRPADAEPLLQQAVANPDAFPTPADFADAATHLAFAAAESGDPATTLQALALRAKLLPPSPQTLFLAAAANDELHRAAAAIDLYKQFLAAANNSFPDQVAQARQRIAALQSAK